MERKFFPDLHSITKCIECFDSFGGCSLGEVYYSWDNVDNHRPGHFIRELSDEFKSICVAKYVDTSSIKKVAQSPGRLAIQRWTPAQRPKINLVAIC